VRRWGNFAKLGKVKGLFEIFVFIFLKMGPGEIKEVTFGVCTELEGRGG
jgi:hypothetical protein